MRVHGNTQSAHWVFTVNNWTEDDKNRIKGLFDDGQATFLVWGLEEAPTTGTRHLQGYICFANRKRMSQVRELIPGHVEPKRGSVQEAYEYCKKDGVWQEWGVLPRDTCCNEIDQFKAWVQDFFRDKNRVPSDKDICLEWTSLWLRQRRHLQDLVTYLCPAPVLQEGTLREWQENMNDVLSMEPDDRTIVFVVDESGGMGKTWFQRWYYSRQPVRTQILSCGKRDDLAHAIDRSKDVFLFNIPRGGMEFFNYGVVEMLKDRLVFSPKYDSQMKVIEKNPHVIVFCNEQPDMTKMTEDRYHVINLS